jgi:hypothetical protein
MGIFDDIADKVPGGDQVRDVVDRIPSATQVGDTMLGLLGGGSGSGVGEVNLPTAAEDPLDPITSLLTQQSTEATEAARIAEEASSRQIAAINESNRLAREGLAFQREEYQKQYDMWEEYFGPVEQNLSDFYSGLSSQDLIATGLSHQAQAHDNVMTKLKQRGAQQGIDSPAMLMMEAQLEVDNATKKAAMRFDAPFKLAQAQQGYAEGGRGLIPGTQGVAGAYGQAAGTQIAGSQAIDPSIAAQQGVSDVFGMQAGLQTDIMQQREKDRIAREELALERERISNESSQQGIDTALGIGTIIGTAFGGKDK